MKLLELLRSESNLSTPKLSVIAGIAAISNMLILVIINIAITDAANKEESVWEAVLFVFVISIYCVAQHHVMVTAISEIELVLEKIRIRIADKIRRCDLQSLEEIGRSAIYSGVQQQTTIISQCAIVLVLGIQFGLLTFFTGLYIAWLSIPAILLTATTTTGVIVFFLRRGRQLKINILETVERENALFDSLTDFLSGFKEVKLNRGRSNDLFNRFQEISNSATSLKVETQSRISTQFIISQITFYIMVAAVVFIVPQFSPSFSESITKTATAILFLIGPISGLVSAIPNLSSANAACESISRLEAQLEEEAKKEMTTLAPLVEFKEITFENVVFTYRDRKSGQPFSVGPINLNIKAGEILFISGGNGTGKSTLMKLLTGLYNPTQGVISLDGVPLNNSSRGEYRTLFSAIFADYHLFDRLYGLSNVGSAKVEEMLKYLELTDKVTIDDSGFDTLELSGGQRKRLALLVSLLEDRPICVYDEVAADQDPTFRKRYYEEILPSLKQQGKALIVVTHDDRYFSVADHLLKMDSGRIVKYD
ncbi:MAG: putative ATP-binding cassette transporter [Pseudohongiellaceae bacterium]